MNSTPRVANWRKALRDRGGKLLQVPLEKEALDRLDCLRAKHGDKTISQLLSEALEALEARSIRRSQWNWKRLMRSLKRT